MYNWHDETGTPYTFWEDYGYNIKIGIVLFTCSFFGVIIGQIINTIL